MNHTTESFFRPAEQYRQLCHINAQLFNNHRLLFIRSKQESLFVPLRTMQIQAVILDHEILFVDGFGQYQRHGQQTGRCISYAWQFNSAVYRKSLTTSVPLDFVCYEKKEATNVFSRLVTEFSTALNISINKLPFRNNAGSYCQIIPLDKSN